MIKSLFKETIRLQFNALMMKTIKGTLKQKKKQLVRFSKREVLFCELGETPLKEQGVCDNYKADMAEFYIMCFTIHVDNERVSRVLKELSERQRAFVLLYYFRDMNDREIARLYHVSRSAVGYTRNRGLEKLKAALNGGRYE